jgi:hypothetical protein
VSSYVLEGVYLCSCHLLRLSFLRKTIAGFLCKKGRKASRSDTVRTKQTPLNQSVQYETMVLFTKEMECSGLSNSWDYQTEIVVLEVLFGASIVAVGVPNKFTL